MKRELRKIKKEVKVLDKEKKKKYKEVCKEKKKKSWRDERRK